LTGSVKLVHDLDVARVNGLGEVNARLVHLLELTRLGHIADSAISGIQLLGLFDSQVEVDITVALHVIVLNLRADEGEDLVLNFAIVGESVLAHGKSLGHANLPLDLVRKIDLVLSAVVLETARRLPGRWLRAIKQERHSFVQTLLGGLAYVLV